MARTYESQQHCPVARTLDIIGDRWTLLILRDLNFGRTRFTDLLESLQGISPNLLSARLKSLEEHGLVERFFYSDHPPRAEYRLTSKGETLRPVIKAIYAWGIEHVPLEPEEAAG